MKKAIKNMRSQLDFDKVGGALLLGLKKPVVKSHGSSKPETICNSILNSLNIYKNNLVPSVEELLSGVDLDAAFGGNDEHRTD
jgi:glycerol-3-phosphate acyltransferase PlsX